MSKPDVCCPGAEFERFTWTGEWCCSNCGRIFGPLTREEATARVDELQFTGLCSTYLSDVNHYGECGEWYSEQRSDSAGEYEPEEWFMLAHPDWNVGQLEELAKLLWLCEPRTIAEWLVGYYEFQNATRFFDGGEFSGMILPSDEEEFMLQAFWLALDEKVGREFGLVDTTL